MGSSAKAGGHRSGELRGGREPAVPPAKTERATAASANDRPPLPADRLWSISDWRRGVSAMAGTYRGLYLLGNKRAQTVRAVEIVDPAGRHTTVRLSEYISQGIQPEHNSCHGRKTWCSDAPIRSHHPEAGDDESATKLADQRR